MAKVLATFSLREEIPKKIIFFTEPHPLICPIYLKMKCISAVTSSKVCDFVNIYLKVGGVQELREGRHVIAEKVERADELVGLGCSE